LKTSRFHRACLLLSALLALAHPRAARAQATAGATASAGSAATTTGQSLGIASLTLQPKDSLVVEPVQPDVSAITPGAPGSAANNFAQRAIISLGGGPILNLGPEIDRIVGDPWTLNDSTAKKLDTLPSNIRLQIESILAQNPRRLQAADAPIEQSSEPAAFGSTPSFTMSPKQTAAMLNEVTGRLGNYFTSDELLDLGVYYLSKQPFFPKTRSDWDRVKNQLGREGIILAVAAIAAEMASNSASVSFGGKLVKLKGDAFKIGWYGSVRDFGFSMKPSLRAGVNVNTPYFEASVGGVEHVNAAANAEQTGLELFVKEHVIQQLLKPTGWDAGLYATAHTYLVDGNPKQEGTTTMTLAGYAKNDHFLPSTFPMNGVLASGSFSTDFVGLSTAKLDVGVVAPRYDFAAGLSAALTESREQPGASGVNIGVFFGGSLESRLELARGAMNTDGERLRTRLSSSQRLRREVERLEARLQLVGADILTPHEEAETRYDYLQATHRHAEAQRDLGTVFREYLESRNKFYVLDGKPSRNQIDDGDGPVEPETMADIRAELDNQPRYRSVGQIAPDPQAVSNGAAAVAPATTVASAPAVVTWGAPAAATRPAGGAQ
jgi:hypothetical protein